MFLVKTIVRSRWDHGPVTAPGEMPADAITDLKTTGNTLSFWTSEQADESALLDAVIGVAAGRDAIAKIEVWFVRRTELEAEGFSTKASPGKTPVVHLRERHVDVVDIDVDCLTKLMMRIDQTLEERHKAFSKKQVERALCAAVRAGQVALKDLNEKLRPLVEAALTAQAAPG
jgi:hypothetical protein